MDAIVLSESPERDRIVRGPSSRVRTLKVMNVAHAKHSAAMNHGRCAPPGARGGSATGVGKRALFGGRVRARAEIRAGRVFDRSSVRNREERRARRVAVTGKGRARTAAPVRPTSRALHGSRARVSKWRRGSSRRLAVKRHVVVVRESETRKERLLNVLTSRGAGLAMQ
jgi:hypothetical protein